MKGRTTKNFISEEKMGEREKEREREREREREKIWTCLEIKKKLFFVVVFFLKV